MSSVESRLKPDQKIQLSHAAVCLVLHTEALLKAG
jgi:hypothetical protein